jgi:hypothetical protein
MQERLQWNEDLVKSQPPEDERITAFRVSREEVVRDALAPFGLIIQPAP